MSKKTLDQKYGESSKAQLRNLAATDLALLDEIHASGTETESVITKSELTEAVQTALGNAISVSAAGAAVDVVLSSIANCTVQVIGNGTFKVTKRATKMGV